MSRLVIRLLGPFEVTLDGEPVAHFETLKTRALLSCLAAASGSPHRREALAEMLWPDRPEGAARANLRHTLRSLRLAIGDYEAEPRFLISTHESIALNPDGNSWVDAHAFTRSLADLRRREGTELHAMEQALDLYRGAFLEDLSLPDSALFEEWRVVKREQVQRKVLDLLSRLIAGYERHGEYERALAYARRQVDLEPWDETARRRVMRLLARSGRRAEALVQYETYRTVLTDELGLEPETETTQLAQRIRDGELEILTLAHARPLAFRAPRFLLEGTDDASPPLFVAREQELARLAALADQALEGAGCVAFVTGGPGVGKSALLDEFVRRAMRKHPELLVARGDCSAYAGAGDPYLPFRDVMAMLTGDLEGRRLAGSIRPDHARRLWDALPRVMTSLLTWGPSLIGTLLDGDVLLSRLADAILGANGWLEHLRKLAEQARTGALDLEQSFIFEQCARVLGAVSERHPLALVLDDVQWADNASIGLLFHLGRRLFIAGSCVLIVCAYRPEEVGPGHRGERHHPLEKVLHELKRTFGDVWVDLDLADQREGRRFVDAFLDAEPNRLGEDFRAALFRRTAGHPLFTIELVRSMQERGDLVRDEADGAWLQRPGLDWQALPARVEAVIEARIDHLGPRLRQIASVASVEGEQFTAEVLAAVQGAAEEPLLRDLRKLETLHRLVREQGEVQIGSRRAATYKFGHVLIQEYLYQRFGRAERRLLHGQVAAALEHLYDGHQSEIAVRLAHHFLRAGDDGPALHYSALAAESAARRYAHEEAITLYTQALHLASRAVPHVATLAGLHGKRGLAHETLGRFERARIDYETALQTGQAAGEPRVEWRALLDLARLWSSRDYGESRRFIDRALDLARRMGDPAVYAESLNWVANWHTNADDLPVAIEYHRQALTVVEQLGDQRDMASTLDRLGLASLIHGDLVASVDYYQRAIALCQLMDDQPGLAASLTGRGLAGRGPFATPTLISPAIPVDARSDLEEALRIARETDSPSAQSWALWSLGLLHAGEGQYGHALDAVRSALSLAAAIGHREWMAGSRSILGHLYVELFAAEEAQLQLRQALALAERLHSQHWIHDATGALAAACCLLNDLAQAQAWLNTLLSPETPMDSIHKRSCWARRAELALLQGRATLALEIAERLIASAPGMSPGRVIPYLWQLKAEALAAMGQSEEAGSLLQTAVRNAQVPGARFLLWRLHASLGHVYGMMGEAAEAEAHVSTARQLVDELADRIPVQNLKDGFLRGAHGLLRSSQ